MKTRAFALSLLLLAVSGAHASSDRSGTFPKAGAAMRLAIQIPRILQMRVLQQPHRLEVTAQDLERGFVLARGLVEVLSTNRDGYQVRAQLAQGPVVEAQVDGLAEPVRVGSGGAQVPMPSMVGKSRPAPYPVEYRLRLAPGTVPGTYAWPVSLSVEEP